MRRGRALVVPAVAIGLSIAACSKDRSPSDVSPSQEPVPPEPTATATPTPSPSDAGQDVAPDGRGPTGLDDGIELPDPNAPRCEAWGETMSTCPFLDACRLADRDSGRCESCEGRCDVLIGRPCAWTSDCDLNLTCFRHRCAAKCLLGSSECGVPKDCIDVGAAPPYGLCNPDAR